LIDDADGNRDVGGEDVYIRNMNGMLNKQRRANRKYSRSIHLLLEI